MSGLYFVSGMLFDDDEDSGLDQHQQVQERDDYIERGNVMLRQKLEQKIERKMSLRDKKHAYVITKMSRDFDVFTARESAAVKSDDNTIIRASSAPITYPKERKVLFLHFHKAGGTSICRYFKDTGTWRVPEKFCICDEKITNHALFSHTRRRIRLKSLDKMFEKSHSDICMMERKWLRPHYFFQIRRIFTGYLVTSLRDPWERFRSNYEKDYSLCSQSERNNKLKNFSIEIYSKLYPRDCPKSYYLRTNTNRPNFYVRMLNGLSIDQYSLDMSESDAGLTRMTERHLEQAKEVLLAFDVVLFLEENAASRDFKLQKLTGDC